VIILAGDVGGTKTNMAFFEAQHGKLVPMIEVQYVSRDFASFDELAKLFLKQHPQQADYACFGVAGPCRHGVCKAMNLPWIVDAKKLRIELNVPWVWVINDLEATAYSIQILGPEEFAVIQNGGDDADGNAAVIAAGTGLGEAGLLWDGHRHRPFACEGGHSDFAPRNALESELFLFLLKECGHVDWERVLSGPGLHNIYRFLCTRPEAKPSAEVAAQLLQKVPPPPAVISRAAMEQRCPVCVEALDLFVSLYGAEANNLALKMMATGGVYIGGGIAPRILPALMTGTFVKAFNDNGWLSSVLEQIPVRVILTDKAALLGAAQCAYLHSRLA
jgi:glucokinase